jgi:hypothetical protein
MNTDYRAQEIKRRADRIRDALAGRDRPDTNVPAQPFVLFGQPIDATNIDEVLVATFEWAERRGSPSAPMPAKLHTPAGTVPGTLTNGVFQADETHWAGS